MEGSMDIYQKVAQFLINVRTNKPRERICQALVMTIIADEHRPLGANEVMQGIERKHRIAVPLERIGRSLESLHRSKSLKEVNGQYFMDEQQEENYRQVIRNRVAFFEEVEQEWIESMQRINRCKRLAETENEEIIRDFRAAISELCERHASKVADFLIGSARYFEHTPLSQEIVDCIPPSNSRSAEILGIETEIFPLFFDASNDRRAKYIAGMAQTYLRRTIFEVETKGHSIFGARIEALNLYFDTNMIFRLLGLDGPRLQKITEHLVSMNRSLGMNTLVDQCSIREFKSVLAYSRKHNIGTRIPKDIFPEVKRKILEPEYVPQIEFALPNDPFALLFWASLEEDFVIAAKRGDILSQWDRFLRHFEAVDIILSVKYKIRIVRDSDDCIADPDAFQELASEVLKASKSHGIIKTPSTSQHDATLFCMIDRLREHETPELFPSNYWVLSADRSLRELDRRMIKDARTDVWHFLSVASWTALIVPFLTLQLVDEADDAVMVAKSLEQPFEYFDTTKTMDAKEVAEVLRRVPETYERGPELVLKCAAHRHFRETVHKTVRAETVTKEMVDEAVIKAFEGVKDKMEAADKNLIDELERRAELEQELGEKLVEERTAREKAEQRLENLEQWLRRIVLTVILLALAVAPSYLGYRLSEPQFSPVNLNAIFWIMGNLYLFVWILFSVTYKTITPRIIAGTFLIGPIIFMIPLFWIYADNRGELIGTISVFLALVSLEAYLVKTHWLDIRVLLRQREHS